MFMRWFTPLCVLAVVALLAGCPPTTTVVTGGDPAAGQATFNTRCSGCHPNPAALAGTQNLITNNMGTVNLAMTGVILSDTEVANLQAFVATQ